MFKQGLQDIEFGLQQGAKDALLRRLHLSRQQNFDAARLRCLSRHAKFNTLALAPLEGDGLGHLIDLTDTDVERNRVQIAVLLPPYFKPLSILFKHGAMHSPAWQVGRLSKEANQAGLRDLNVFFDDHVQRSATQLMLIG